MVCQDWPFPNRVAALNMNKIPAFSTSNWPLPAHGTRLQTPYFLLELLSEHPLSEGCYPLAFGYYPDAAGHEMQRREHTNHLLIYCVKGRGSLQSGSDRWPVGPGDLMLVPPDMPHAYQADADEPWSIYWVHYDGERAKSYSDFLGIERPVFNIGVLPSLIAEFEALLSLRHSGYALAPFVHGANILKSLLTGFAEALRRSAQGRGGLDIQALIGLMQRRLDEDLDLNDLAREAHLSKYHFIRRFRQLTGHTPVQHFIHLKMQHACELLDSSNDPLKRIAAQVGYEDPYYFSRIFKRVIGVSPKQYRNSGLT